MSTVVGKRNLYCFNITYLKINYRKVCRFIPRQERIDYSQRNVFIKNFGEDFTDHQLSQAFAPFGTILSAKVEKDENGQGKGFGFVCYDSRQAAAKVLKAEVMYL